MSAIKRVRSSTRYLRGSFFGFHAAENIVEMQEFANQSPDKDNHQSYQFAKPNGFDPEFLFQGDTGCFFASRGQILAALCTAATLQPVPLLSVLVFFQDKVLQR